MSTSTQNNIHHQIVIVGGGAAGITIAAQLRNQNNKLDLAIIEPSDKHYYQPAWTLVGGGEYQIKATEKLEKDLIPSGVTWIKDYADKFEPDKNLVITRENKQIEYDYLIVCPGIQINWHSIPGLLDSLGKGGVTSNYSKDYAPYTWETIKNFSGGTAIFTYPATPIKCAGAPQKIMYMADEIFRQRGIRDQSQIIYCTAGASVFAIPEYCRSLEQIIERKNIDARYHHDLKAIKPDTKEAIFAVNANGEEKEVSIKYDMIHVTPPMSAPDFIKNSPLALKDNPGGWVDVDKYNLQHNVYPNVFSLGDASSLPTSKTAAAIRKEAPALVENLLSLMADKKELNGKYNGYACCPLITGYGKTIMAEFDYDKNLTPSFPLDPTQERFTMWLVKRYVLPWLYWNRMLKGQPFEPDLWRFLLPR